MSLTPLEIENTKFRGAFNGYNRSEVDLLLSKASQELEARLKQIEELQRRISQLEQTVATYRESEELLKNSVVLAQRTSDEIIAAAHQQADAIRREAESAGRETARRLGELKAEREQFEYAFHGLLAGFLHRLEQGNPALVQRLPAAAELPASGAGVEREASHSRELMSEAGSSHPAPGERGDLPPIPQVDLPPVPTVPTPGGPATPQHTPQTHGDDFAEAVEAARPTPRQEWPDPPPLEPVEDLPLDAASQPVDAGNLGSQPIQASESGSQPRENQPAGPHGDQAVADRLPLE